MKINKMMGTFICVKMVEVGEKSAGGIFLPDSMKEKQKTRAVVVAVGPGHHHMGQLIPTGLEVGDKVLFTHTSSIARMEDEDGQEFFFMQAHDIMAVIED